MRQFIEESWKRDFVCPLLKPMHALACFEIFDKFTINNNNTYLFHSFSISEYLEASWDLSMTIHGKEPLPLKTKPLSFMPKHEYDCLSIDLLGQSYKGCIGTNSHGSYIQSYFTERTGSEHVNSHSSQHVFAFVKWFKSTSDKTRELEGVELLQNEFYKQGFQSILLVHRILLTVAIRDNDWDRVAETEQGDNVAEYLFILSFVPTPAFDT
ncbi:hypothetical protein PHYBLDRAFT_151289 [Phycomyces blakesleeanus NRRL 1555(-)]|uniref:Uncharacterized protein n=1 Tax=Phycomyces blakesleeanus (strain ATCC 8743b / DSM 1359 / FGSC 10004 / NBRC 33097 / NRRL 1555) TaxID=763407 RepID=A0A163D073_PHYB8|nr:hypothetical protein PHYBLDRAFT_151289 [Phycomyces blakesleeanus NRRL 1555(-)]OAD67760.1 hypothetical protein PHYBLDRAFT_151289 [Phycomyces blakesleeanus NRRL 1555(-)]|eukprot:XP_018285800.1 hypothetical protein PHYBLDRAFT_151289 [Phycomyces blakesleeanus NRRL 1555(-)]